MSKKCRVCNKSVYPNDPQINLDGTILHKPCAKCEDCQCQITLANFCKNETEGSFVLLCKTHYFKRFHEGGSYLGGEKFQVKNPRDALGNETGSTATAVVSNVSNTTIGNDSNMLPLYKLKSSGIGPSVSSSSPVKTNTLGDFSMDQLVNELESRGYIVDLKKKDDSNNSLPPPIPVFNPEENIVVDESIDTNNNSSSSSYENNSNNDESNQEAVV